jgi:hypothetical protein
MHELPVNQSKNNEKYFIHFRNDTSDGYVSLCSKGRSIIF